MAREKELRRSLAVFPIGTVMKLTDLTARQIRYYEDQGLIQPERIAVHSQLPCAWFHASRFPQRIQAFS